MKLSSLVVLTWVGSGYAHVAMTYVEGSNLAIRNAGSATGDGRGSVANACGGNAAFGANGVGQIKDGDQVTLAINYAAGHQSNNNAFSMRYACGDGSAASVEAAAAKVPAADCTATAAGAAADYGANGVAAPKAIVPGGYTVTCTLPKKDNAAAQDCTLSLADQRDWGGCVDVSVLPAAAALPPAPPPAPLVSNQGTYVFTAANMVDTSAETFNCCPLSSGSLEVPGYTPLNSPTFIATFKDVKALNCRTSQLPTAPETASHTISGPVTLQYVSGSKYEAKIPATPGATSFASQPFDIVIEGGRLDFKNTGADQPIICDGFSNSAAAATPSPPGGVGAGAGSGAASQTAEGSGNSGTTVVIALLAVAALVGGYFYWKKKQDEKPLPPPTEGMYPAAAGGGLPDGWTEMSDPNSGAKYYYNSKTGETTWTKPNQV